MCLFFQKIFQFMAASSAPPCSPRWILVGFGLNCIQCITKFRNNQHPFNISSSHPETWHLICSVYKLFYVSISIKYFYVEFCILIISIILKYFVGIAVWCLGSLYQHYSLTGFCCYLRKPFILYILLWNLLPYWIFIKY